MTHLESPEKQLQKNEPFDNNSTWCDFCELETD